MKKSILSLLLVAAVASSAIAKSPKNTDPVLMTIDDKPVTVSEFNYLFEKNNSQQSQPQTIDEYLDMFVVYKLKVADAEKAGLQNSSQFEKEYNGYRRDLAEPYLIDSEAKEKLVNEFYNRLKQEIHVNHIMVEKPFGNAALKAAYHSLDSIRSLIVDGKESFADAARKNSIDRSAQYNGGDLGWMSAGRYPYSFENVAFATADGEISPVFETPFGLHIIKVDGHREARGEVLAQHILCLTQGLSEDEQAAKETEINEIYAQLMAGADFDTLAKEKSEDPGSAQNGGKLPWFGTGRMVPEFEEMAFSLADGEISKPFRTSYGWHIIKKLESKGLEPLDKLRHSIESFIDQDDRKEQPVQNKTRELIDKFAVSTDAAVLDDLIAQINAAGGLTTELVDSLNENYSVIITGQNPVTAVNVAQVAAILPSHVSNLDADEAVATFIQCVDTLKGRAATDAEREVLATENAEYRNLLNEYRDGMLLFEISDKKVWSKAKTDTEGLTQFFNDHKADYTNWTAPKFKGFVIFATSDSISNEAQKFLQGTPIERQDVVGVLKSRYGKDIKVERVIAAQGENRIIDWLAFGGEPSQPSGKWTSCFEYQGEIIDQPVEPDDVRSAVTTDYQNYLEGQWIETLRKEHKVKINDKELKKLRSKK